jgi:hypothetical protein
MTKSKSYKIKIGIEGMSKSTILVYVKRKTNCLPNGKTKGRSAKL